ncbi:hypothetical protein JCM14076_32200 [Methylosoma difficile]
MAGNASVIPFYPAEDQNLRQELADKRDSGLNLAYRGDIDIRTRRAQLEGGECQMAHMPIHAIQAWGGRLSVKTYVTLGLPNCAQIRQ